MKEFRYIIKDEIGMHARPAGLLVVLAREFESKILLEVNGKTAQATKLMSLMCLGAKCEDEIVVKIEGEDEEAALERVKAFFLKNL